MFSCTATRRASSTSWCLTSETSRTMISRARPPKKGSAEPPSILKAIFHEAAGSDGLLAAWLASDARDGDIDAKAATPELKKLVRSRLGLELPDAAELSEVSQEDLAEILDLALEGRRRVKEQLKKMGAFEYHHTSFSYTRDETGEERKVLGGT